MDELKWFFIFLSIAVIGFFVAIGVKELKNSEVIKACIAAGNDPQKCKNLVEPSGIRAGN